MGLAARRFACDLALLQAQIIIYPLLTEPVTMAKKKKLKTVFIKLISTAGTGYFYVTRKNPINAPHKLILRKHDPRVNQHVLFKEAKMKFSTTAAPARRLMPLPPTNYKTPVQSNSIAFPSLGFRSFAYLLQPKPSQ